MRILLIRLRLIGDVVFTTPVLRALKRAFPASRLTYLVEQEAAPIVTGNPHVDEVIVIPRTRGWKRLLDDARLARRLRSERFDVVLDLHGGPRSSWLARASGARQRIGYDVQGRGWMYTATVHRARQLRPRHSVVNQWDLLSAIDGWTGGTPDPARDPVEMPLDDGVDALVARRLHEAGVEDGHELIVLHVSAGNPFRRWPEPSFVRLSAGLAARGRERRLVLSSGPSDREAARRIVAAARAELGPDRACRIVDCGEFDLAELRALVGRSRLFIGGDSGPLHVAATTRTPIVGLYGPTLPSRSAPWRDPAVPTESVEVIGLACRPCDQRVCEPGDYRCLTTVTPEHVMLAAERAMRARG
ncbi:MAG TPA: glycosyltransferase family 9 protein [Vicinamibacterales bacterium]|nr:glycosyltransferase family 9 protein [Vicinamibacterales bacterium]